METKIDLGDIVTLQREVTFRGGAKWDTLAIPFLELSIDFSNATPEGLLAEAGDLDKIELASKVSEYKQVECYNCLYIVGPVAGFPMKIGITDRIKHRLSNLQSSSWQELRLYALLWGPGSAAFSVEQRVMADAKRTGIHERGEWIATTPASLMDMVIDAARVERQPLMTSAMAIENKGRMMVAQDAAVGEYMASIQANA